MSNNNKTYLVTGATRGIGGAISKKLLEEGAFVIMHFHVNKGVLPEMEKTYGNERVLGVKANLETDEGVDHLWDRALAWRGSLNGLVNNAGRISDAFVEESLDEWREEWRRTLQVNTQALADLCRNAILFFKKNGGGAIVNISSRAGFRGDLPGSMHYAASKGAVVALTRSIAKGFARDNIQAYNVAPGWVKTERVSPILEDPENKFMIEEIPTGQPAPPEELGNLVAFLLSGKVKQATGATFDVNGASYFH